MDTTLEALFEYCINLNASDLHLTPNILPRARIEGVLKTLMDFSIVTPCELKQIFLTLLSKEEYIQLEQKHELDCSISFARGRIRAHFYHQNSGLSAAFRFLPSTIPTLQNLYFPKILEQLVTVSDGLIIIAGPTGSGKSTTLASMIHHINQHENAHIITIEDPIEFMHHNDSCLIHQREVKRDTQSFHTALRAALREDPDVILIGEMRDLETIRLALTAAETGHLVLTTLHASSAPRVIHRMTDVFHEAETSMIRHQLAESLQAVICQKLINHPIRGRMAILEILVSTPAVRHLIRDNKIMQLESIIQTNQAIGMCTFEQYYDQFLLT